MDKKKTKLHTFWSRCLIRTQNESTHNVFVCVPHLQPGAVTPSNQEPRRSYLLTVDHAVCQTFDFLGIY